MNDYSVEIFNQVRDALAADYPGLFCTTGQISDKDVRLPALQLTFSFAGQYGADSSGEEVWTETVVDAQAYSGTSLAEARSIMGAVDRALYRMNFRRSNLTQVPNADPSIRRCAAKWRALVNKGGVIAAR